MLASSIAGCASLSKDQCLNGNWQQIGFNDGLRGLTPQQLDEHAKACAEYGVQTNFDQYMLGRSRGLLNYCQPQNAFNVGRAGQGENVAACPPNMQNDFVFEFRRGQEINQMESELESIRSRVVLNNSRISRNDGRIYDIRNELRRTDLSNDARAALLNEFRTHFINRSEMRLS
ncbi:DUF2799 domain-containing protein [Undibacterium terreum]|uniref:DUF2799 domain-containing protein n=1 Tax=Undibacterium terreum TaxID=1224302 RepID=UPI001664E4FC|nr:DUF2799 domain-containing protein [Undibacterium terreum]